mgnify:CR=1 FL=1
MSNTIEERLARVERELELLKSHADSDPSRPGWISAVTGSFKDDPDFEEILRLGRAARDADQMQSLTPDGA